MTIGALNYEKIPAGSAESARLVVILGAVLLIARVSDPQHEHLENVKEASHQLTFSVPLSCSISHLFPSAGSFSWSEARQAL